MSKFNPFSQRTKAKLKALNAAEPAPQLSQVEYAKLQKQWYAKLAKDGFKDIEWVDHQTGQGHNSGFLRGSMGSGKAYHAGRDLYFQLASNYLLHCQSLKRRQYHYFIWKLHAAGHTYGSIQKAVKRKFGKKLSHYTIYYDIKEIAKLCYEWNAKHPEGLLLKRAEDREKLENTLADFTNTEYNWLINEQYAAEERDHAKRKKNFRK